MFSQSRGEPYNVVRNILTDFPTILFDLVQKKIGIMRALS